MLKLSGLIASNVLTSPSTYLINLRERMNIGNPCIRRKSSPIRMFDYDNRVDDGFGWYPWRRCVVYSRLVLINLSGVRRRLILESDRSFTGKYRYPFRLTSLINYPEYRDLSLQGSPLAGKILARFFLSPTSTR